MCKVLSVAVLSPKPLTTTNLFSLKEVIGAGVADLAPMYIFLTSNKQKEHLHNNITVIIMRYNINICYNRYCR